MEIPYGKISLTLDIDTKNCAIFQPNIIQESQNSEISIVKGALNHPINQKSIEISPKTTIGVGINDQSRPIPHHILLPELVDFLVERGARKENITFFIATGTHKPVSKDLFHLIADDNLLRGCEMVSHDCDDAANQIKIGNTTRNTPVFVNKSYYECDIKVVVGNIESHHFMGFSGGYKTASIGLTSRETITGNHALLTDPRAKMGLFSTNPMRLEVEEIGEMIGVDFALNVVIDPEKRIQACYWGSPDDVILKGVNYIRTYLQLDLGDVLHQFDLVIASAGGYPKDINFYQAQKALTHACLFAKPGGRIILAAECRDGFGSEKFERFITSKSSAQDVTSDFENREFEIGPHKAYQLAKQAIDHEITVISSMSPKEVERLKLKSLPDMQMAVDKVIKELPVGSKIAILPYATQTMPKIRE